MFVQLYIDRYRHMTIIMREKDVFNLRRGWGGADGRNMGGKKGKGEVM